MQNIIFSYKFLSFCRKVLLLLIIALFPLSGFSQYVRYPVKNYTGVDYGKNLEPKIWCIASDSRDVMYFGASNYVLQFDGKKWDKIFVKPSTWVTSMAVSKNGVVFIGGNNEFGFLSPNNIGKLKYHSISDSLKNENMHFGVIWKTHIIGNKVYFQSEEMIFVYEKGKVSTIQPTNSFHLSFVSEDRLFVVERGIGVLEIIDNQITSVDPDSVFKDKGAFSIVKKDNKNSIIFTKDDGLWNFNPITPLENENAGFLNKFSIYGAIGLSDGNIAINTLDNGLIICDKDLNIISITNNSNGLLVNGVMQAMQDRFGNIWLATDNGISFVEYTSQFSYFNNTEITGNIFDVRKFDGKFVVASSDGLFIQKENKEKFFNLVFERQDLVQNAVRSLEVVKDELIIGTDEGIYSYKNSQIKEIISGLNGFDMVYSEKLNLLFIGGKEGLIACKRNTAWEKAIDFEDIFSDLKNLILLEKQNNVVEVWSGTLNDGLFRVVVDSAYSIQTFNYTEDMNLLPKGWVTPFLFENQIIVGSGFGLYTYTEEEVEEGITDLFFEQIPFANTSLNSGFILFSDMGEEIFTYIDNMPGIFNKKSKTIDSTSFMNFYIGRINFLFHENDSITWLGGNDGLARFFHKKVKNFDIPFNVIINSVELPGKEIFAGIYFENDIQENDSLFKMLFVQPENFKPVLDYKDNSLTFYFSATFYEGIDKIQFSYKIEGYSSKFSEWTNDNKLSLNNLSEGKYKLIVKARNVYGRETEEVYFEFEILPPWYRTTWAYALYVLFGIFLIFIIVRLYSYKLKRENKKLERIVKERTFEIEQQKEEITAQRDEIETQHEIVTKQKDAIEEMHEELKDSINYAERIQLAILPPKTIIEAAFEEHFILFMPRDIVSGDFYWATEIDNKVIVSVADCTGHGVPGAFMSMLGIAFLNDVVNKEKITDTAQILNLLRNEVMKALKQEKLKDMQMKDGMDISMVLYDKETGIVQFSGANNSLYVVSEKNPELLNSEDLLKCSPLEDNNLNSNVLLTEIKADKMPIAIYERMDSFSSVKFKAEPGMSIVMFSDGYADQFGGPYPGGKKFKYKTFKKLLVSINEKSLEKQKEILQSNYNEWTSHIDELTGKTFDQVDDICIIGLRF
ncbi:MAG: SpoIIE family protein phosphatase [Bacteroidales bacterium]|nr:SpoIIE family protein phosphatase [Bacteroidales bacterium]